VFGQHPLSVIDWGVLALAAFTVGFSKTGVPGTGIVAVPMFAAVFGGRLSVGTSLPLLILADCFAVSFYRKEARMDHLARLLPWVLLGLGFGTYALFELGHLRLKADPLNPIIGWIVLVMLILSQIKGKWGERLIPTSKFGTWLTGALAGFTTMVSNAAGPIMQIYLVATKMPKQELMGTTALYFFSVNCFKIPFYLWLSADNPAEPMWSVASLKTVALVAPVLLVGAYLGRKLLPYIPQETFKRIVLVFAALGALKLILF
jgi:uncharacterized protein